VIGRHWANYTFIKNIYEMCDDDIEHKVLFYIYAHNAMTDEIQDRLPEDKKITTERLCDAIKFGIEKDHESTTELLGHNMIESDDDLMTEFVTHAVNHGSTKFLDTLSDDFLDLMYTHNSDCHIDCDKKTIEKLLDAEIIDPNRLSDMFQYIFVRSLRKKNEAPNGCMRLKKFPSVYDSLKYDEIKEYRFYWLKRIMEVKYEDYLVQYHKRIMEEVLSEIDSHPENGNWYTVNNPNTHMMKLVGSKYLDVLDEIESD
jgi:hypothetical protein